MATAKSKTRIVVEMTLDKTTPGTYRYKEPRGDNGERPIIGTLYVTKEQFPGAVPEVISVTVEPA